MNSAECPERQQGRGFSLKARASKGAPGNLHMEASVWPALATAVEGADDDDGADDAMALMMRWRRSGFVCRVFREAAFNGQQAS